MDHPDLDAVIARRKAIEAELTAIDNLRAALKAESDELSVAERVLKKLSELPSIDDFGSLSERNNETPSNGIHGANSEGPQSETRE